VFGFLEGKKKIPPKKKKKRDVIRDVDRIRESEKTNILKTERNPQ